MICAAMEGIRWAFRSGPWKPTKQEWLLGLSCVQPEEEERIMKFVFKKDAKSALVGRLLLRKVISEYLQIPYNDIQLKRTEKGKPYLDNKIVDCTLSNFNFNISHQGDYCVLAAEPENQVGVDVMKTAYQGGTTVPGFFHTMRKQFTSTEWSAVKSQSSEWTQLQMFYRHWCLKESYVKATGVGIGHDLQSIEFRLNTQDLRQQVVTTDTQLYLAGKELKTWRFEETKLDDLHQVSVALGPPQLGVKSHDTIPQEERSPAPRFTDMRFEDLVSCAVPRGSDLESDWTAFERKRESSR